MNKLEYIPGDIVKIEYGEATGKIGFVTNTFLRRKGCYNLVVFIGKGFQDSSKDDWIQTYNNEVSPIPLTSEILEKNGWRVEKGDYINDNYHIRLCEKIYGYSAYKVANDTIVWLRDVKSISDLQHLFFGLELNSEIKV